MQCICVISGVEMFVSLFKLFSQNKQSVLLFCVQILRRKERKRSVLY